MTPQRLPFLGALPEALQPQRIIRIEGVIHPSHLDWIYMDIQSNNCTLNKGEIILHQRIGIGQQAITRNTFHNNVWMEEETDGKSPLRRGRAFEMIILTKPNKFTLVIDGQYFCDFDYRLPLSDGKYVAIKGPLDVLSIKYEGSGYA